MKNWFNDQTGLTSLKSRYNWFHSIMNNGMKEIMSGF